MACSHAIIALLVSACGDTPDRYMIASLRIGPSIRRLVGGSFVRCLDRGRVRRCSYLVSRQNGDFAAADVSTPSQLHMGYRTGPSDGCCLARSFHCRSEAGV